MLGNKNLKVLKISNHRNKPLIKECCQMAYQSMIAQELDYRVVNEKSFTKINPVFCLLKSDKLIGYIAFWQKTLKNNDIKFTTWVIWDFFIEEDERRQGFGTFLFDYALKNMNISIEDILYSAPVSENFRDLLYKMNLRKIKLFFRNALIESSLRDPSVTT
jgi:hypothetical protein